MTGLQMRANDTGRMARLAFNELVYAGHPYAPSVSGYETTIPAITRDDLLAFPSRSFWAGRHDHYRRWGAFGPRKPWRES